MKITFTIPDDKAKELLDSFCAQCEYKDGDETKEQFFRRKTIEFWTGAVLKYRVEKAVQTAKKTELEKPTIQIV